VLRTSPRLAYNGLALILGATEPFPTEAEFRRYNHLAGHRTDLCRNATLVRELKEALDQEYVVIERSLTFEGGEAPEELKLRLTRCDREQELEECEASTLDGSARKCSDVGDKSIK
ncbi:unnamed protein product, partial [Polarella glacialis]